MIIQDVLKQITGDQEKRKERNTTMAVTLDVNGRVHQIDVDPETPLLYVLRNDLGLKGAKFACGLGQCAACNIIIDGRAVPSCRIPAGSVQGKAQHHVLGDMPVLRRHEQQRHHGQTNALHKVQVQQPSGPQRFAEIYLFRQYDRLA